jgi:V8-like Glu-specific endopeptidase
MSRSYYKDAYTVQVTNEPLAEVPERDYYRHDNNVLKENTPVCTGLYITCGERLHTKPKDIEPCGDTSWSWYAAIFKEGKYLCSGTLISNQWVLTSTYCAQSVE